MRDLISISVLSNKKNYRNPQSATSPPLFTSPPSINGTPRVNTAVSYTPGIVTGNPTPSVTRQWLFNGLVISGATDITYTPTIGQLGGTLSIQESATNTVGGPILSTSSAITIQAADTGTISISTPLQYEVHQRTGNFGSIQISGTHTGFTDTIEASFNGGPYSDVQSSVPAGNFSGTITLQAAGQGTLTVRKKSSTNIQATVSLVGIGDIFMTAGDSIAEGRGDNPQVYSNPTLKATMFYLGQWQDLQDSGPNHGSHWPLMATQIMAQTGFPVAFIKTGVGGTDVAGVNNQWAKPNSAYSGAISAVNASSVTSFKGILDHLEPNAIVNPSTLSQSTYNTAVDTLVSNFTSDLPPFDLYFGVVCGQVITGNPPDPVAAKNNTRGAVMEAWADNPKVAPGCVLIDQAYRDGVHPLTDPELLEVGNRFWMMLKEKCFGGSAGEGRGPRLVSAAWNGTRNQLTLIYDRALKTGQTHSTACHLILDNGSTMTITSVTYNSGNVNSLFLNTSTSAIGPAGTTTVTFANGDTAAGVVVPRSTDISLVGGGTVSLPAEPYWNHIVSG